MQVGDEVEVRSRFEDAWTPGFKVAELLTDGYRLSRLSDGAMLPGFTSEADVRPRR